MVLPVRVGCKKLHVMQGTICLSSVDKPEGFLSVYKWCAARDMWLQV